MKKAAIDIGTNSVRLLIAEVDKRVQRIEKLTTITRLGRGVDSSRMLSNAAIARNIEVLMYYRTVADKYNIAEVKAIATSAVRDAANREEFINLVKEKTGISVEVISGKREAELGYIGASSIVEGRACTVIDIGGGSTELITGDYGRIETSKSIDVGAVRVTEKFFSSGIIDEKSIGDASNYISKLASDIISSIKAAGMRELIGIGGTATTLAAIDMALNVYDPDRVNGYKLSSRKVKEMFNRLSSMSLEERKGLPGLQVERADIITAGALVLKTIMEDLGTDSIMVSENDNLEGLLLS